MTVSEREEAKVSDSKTVFREIAAAPRGDTAVVFDLDSTLFTVAHRTQAILDDLWQKEHEFSEHASLLPKLREVRVTEKDWGLHGPLARVGVSIMDPVFPIIRRHWKREFFSSRYLDRDLPYVGAVDYVCELARLGFPILYLTGRDRLNMEDGTVRSLETWRFPLVDEGDLYMKPTKGDLLDEDYKSLEMNRVLKRFPRVWFFENEPVILNRVAADHPQVRLVFMDTVHSARAQSPTHLPSIPGRFER
jgi:hypothetical protein